MARSTGPVLPPQVERFQERQIPTPILSAVRHVGYVFGVGTNLLLALTGNPVGWLVGIIVFPGTSIAIEETLEKAVAAELLPRELCGLGFGFLACANAAGDMASSL
ncbi:MAG: MFS transporter [Nitrospira sp.]|nr:MAG: MFS transporter [Nitrospira sp.]